MSLKIVDDFSVKTVDMTSKNWPELVVESFKTTGFAVLKNHSLDFNLVNLAYQQWEDFFKSDRKMRYVTKRNSGYIPFKTENAKDSIHKDLKEFYHLFYPFSEVPSGVNQYTMSKLSESMLTVARHILFVLQPHVPKYMEKIHDQPLHMMVKGSEQNLLRILHYPPISNAMPGEVRAAAHEDINLITLLPAATQPGLEVMDLSGRWYKIESDPGTLIVNVGDMLQEATDGVFKSTTHRVVNPDSADLNVSRYSMPFFVHPRPDVVLSKHYTAGEYLEERLKEIGL